MNRENKLLPDQAWFWCKQWQQLEQAAQEDIDAGRVAHFDSVDDVLQALEALGSDAKD